MQVNASRLLRSACLSIVALILGVGIVAFTAKAASYSFSNSISANWTATAAAAPIWTCTPSGAGDACGEWPGQLPGLPAPDVANISTSSGVITVDTSIPNPVTLNLSQGNLDVATGGQLSLIGNSTVGGGVPAPNLSISGGTLSNTGMIGITGPTFGGALTMNGGTLNGAGTTNFGSSSVQINFTGAQGPMTIDQQQVTTGTTANFSANNTLTMSNGAKISNSGTFNASGNGTIAPGAGTSSFINTGTLQKSSGTNFTLGVPFANSSTASVFSTGVGMSFTGGSAPDHNNATWNVVGPGGTMNFGGAHVFNGTETFTGTGSMNVLSGGTWTLNTSATLASGLSLTNAGTIKFTTPTAGSATLTGGTYTQSGSFQPRLGV
ncbi:MAG TPA: hypothetical protein VLU46_11655, partial [Thermoanaerobaculia bacterium]|nr:hypothetical protein [Thermoanaerobaculia bacterium]